MASNQMFLTQQPRSHYDPLPWWLDHVQTTSSQGYLILLELFDIFSTKIQ